jgi:MFS family permease
VLIVVGVREPAQSEPATARRVQWRDLRRLGRPFALVTGVAMVLTLARFSEAFLVLRGHDVGLSNLQAPWIMVVMSTVYAALAYPAGGAADRGHSGRLLLGGFVALIASDLVLAWAATPTGALVGAALWGLHMALTQGLLAALVSATAPADLRGTAFGVFNLGCGVALLVASVLAGLLWDAFGPAFTFYAGAGFTALALAGWLLLRRGLPALAKAA